MDAEKQFPCHFRSGPKSLNFQQNRSFLSRGNFVANFQEGKSYIRDTSRSLIQKFRDSGSVANNKTHSGVPLTARTPAGVQDIRTRLEQSPQKSTTRMSQEVWISSSVMRVIHSDVKLFPYKVQVLDAQSQANKNQRYEFWQSISERIENNPRLLDVLLLSDEAHFHLKGLVSKQNMSFWASTKPHEHVQAPWVSE